MKPDPAFEGTLVLDICSEDEKIREALWLQDGREPQALSIFHHLGMFVDTVLIGPLTFDCTLCHKYTGTASLKKTSSRCSWRTSRLDSRKIHTQTF